MVEASTLRPHGIKRKILQSPAIALQTAGDFIIGYLPHGAHILDINLITTVALTTADAVIDIGVAKDGDTIIDGLTVVTSGSAIADIIDAWNTKGTNGGLVDIPVETLLWLQTDGGPDAGTVIVSVEYEDQNS